MALPFESLLNSLDPPSTDIIKTFKDIVEQRYFISKNLNTSYNEVGEMTVLERRYLIEFLAREFKEQEEKIKNLQKEQEVKLRKKK